HMRTARGPPAGHPCRALVDRAAVSRCSAPRRDHRVLARQKSKSSAMAQGSEEPPLGSAGAAWEAIAVRLTASATAGETAASNTLGTINEALTRSVSTTSAIALDAASIM